MSETKKNSDVKSVPLFSITKYLHIETDCGFKRFNLWNQKEIRKISFQKLSWHIYRMNY